MANDTFLNAFGMGASLADRARNYQLDLAKFALQQQAQDMNMKISNLQYADALKESQAQNEDVQNWYKTGQEVQQFLNDPTKPLPSPAPFKSKRFQQEWDKTLSGLEQFSARAVYDKQQATLNALALQSNSRLMDEFNTIGKEIQSADPVNGSALVNQFAQQIRDPKTGLVIPEKLNEFRTAAAPIRQKIQAKKDINLIPNLAKMTDEAIDAGVDAGNWTQEQGEAAKSMRAQGLTAGERTMKKLTADQVESAKQAWGNLSPVEEDQIRNLAENRQWKRPYGDEGKEFVVNKTIARTADELINKINDYEKMYPGKLQNWVGIIGGNKAKLQQKLVEAKTDEDKKALEILQFANKNINSDLLSKSGKAVTGTEQARLLAEIGDLKSANFINAAKNFAAFSAFDYASNINDFKTKYQLSPTEVKQAENYRTKYNLSGFEPFINAPSSSQTPPVSAPAGGSVTEIHFDKNGNLIK